MRVAVVEDDQLTRAKTVEYFRRFQVEYNTVIEIEEFSDGRELISGYSPRFDLIILDIEMKDLNGMKTAEKIRETDMRVLIVFLTHMSGYAIRGYAVQASDYILKPLSYELFAGKMKEWIRRIEHSREKSTLIVSGEETIKLSTDHIYYLEVIGHRLIYHTDQGEIEVWGKLKTAEEELAGKGFAMCNKCYLVNLKHVQKITKNQVLVGPDSLIISRPRKKDFLQALTDYIGSI
jgi:DNA-binding LytR/AlgR family response regulator